MESACFTLFINKNKSPKVKALLQPSWSCTSSQSVSHTMGSDRAARFIWRVSRYNYVRLGDLGRRYCYCLGWPRSTIPTWYDSLWVKTWSTEQEMQHWRMWLRQRIPFRHIIQQLLWRRRLLQYIHQYKRGLDWNRGVIEMENAGENDLEDEKMKW